MPNFSDYFRTVMKNFQGGHNQISMVQYYFSLSLSLLLSLPQSLSISLNLSQTRQHFSE